MLRYGPVKREHTALRAKCAYLHFLTTSSRRASNLAKSRTCVTRSQARVQALGVFSVRTYRRDELGAFPFSLRDTTTQSCVRSMGMLEKDTALTFSMSSPICLILVECSTDQTAAKLLIDKSNHSTKVSVQQKWNVSGNEFVGCQAQAGEGKSKLYRSTRRASRAFFARLSLAAPPRACRAPTSSRHTAKTRQGSLRACPAYLPRVGL